MKNPINRNLLKAFDYKSKNILERIYLSDYMNWFYNSISWLRVKYQMIERMFFWGWKMRYSYDFDAQTIYDMLYFKLDRIYTCMKNHHNLTWNDNENTPLMRRLCEAKELTKRLSQDDLYNNNYEKFSEKYRGLKEDSFSERRHDIYPNAKAINHELYRYMLIKSFTKDKELRKIDKQRLFYLLDKYIDGWWD